MEWFYAVGLVSLGVGIGWVAFERPEIARNAWDSIIRKVK